MNLLLLGILSVIILLPVAFQIVFTVRRIKGKSALSILMIVLWTLGLVIITTAAATLLFQYGTEYLYSNNRSRDINGMQFFPLFGIITALVFTPLIGIIGWLVIRLRKVKVGED